MYSRVLKTDTPKTDTPKTDTILGIFRHLVKIRKKIYRYIIKSRGSVKIILVIIDGYNGNFG